LNVRTVPFARASIDAREIEAVTRVLESGWLTLGPETAQFETEFAAYVGAREAVAVNSCTSALFLSLQLLGIGPGDEVLVPSFTFAATANVVRHCGAEPVFVDILPDGFTIDPADAERKRTARTRAAIPVHYGGNVAADLGVPTVEDSAHRIVPNHRSPNLVCYSFYATKSITTGEGGMVTTDDPDQAHWLRQARLHGLSRDAWQRYGTAQKWRYEVEFSGFKMNTIDMLSAIGRVQLTKLDEMEQARLRAVDQYNRALSLSNRGSHLYPILVERRDDFIANMAERGIGCSFHFTPLHKAPAFAGSARSTLPVTEFVGARVVTLPLFAGITSEDVEYVCGATRAFGEFQGREYGLPVIS
jgi:dTDP-4-amino-4,6-dideoxygalactose transaminase